MLKTNLKYLLPVLLITACGRNKESDTAIAPLYLQPISVELNTEGGYTTNMVNGDSIEPLILYDGDTLVTGVPIPAIGKLIHPDSVNLPKTVAATKPDSKINAQPNRHKIPKNLTQIPVNKNSLISIPIVRIAKNDTSHYLVSSTGDTIPTGIPVPSNGKKVPCLQPQPTNGLLPRFKDAAITNLQYLDVDQGLSSSYVWSIYEDKDGNIWFGTAGGGVSKYDGQSFTHFTGKEGLSNNSVLSILEDKSGNIWFGTYGGGVSK